MKLFVDNKTITGFNLRHLLHHQGGEDIVRQAVNQVFKLWSEKKIEPVVDSTWALEDLPEAMQKMHDRKNIGKIVLDPSVTPKPKPVTPAKTKSKEKKNANHEEKKAVSVESDDGEKKLTNGTSEDKSDSGEKIVSSVILRVKDMEFKKMYCFQIRRRRNQAELLHRNFATTNMRTPTTIQEIKIKATFKVAIRNEQKLNLVDNGSLEFC